MRLSYGGLSYASRDRVHCLAEVAESVWERLMPLPVGILEAGMLHEGLRGFRAIHSAAPSAA